jgi:3-hydroxyacyl-[acyl-carrier-protein] dehydratase
MKLMDDFFRIRVCNEAAASFEFVVELNPGHIIYKGHFPGHPVTPGVIQLQMVQELLELKLNHKLHVTTIAQSKFLSVLNPEKDCQLRIVIDYRKTSSGYAVKALGKTASAIIFKLETSYNL